MRIDLGPLDLLPPGEVAIARSAQVSLIRHHPAMSRPAVAQAVAALDYLTDYESDWAEHELSRVHTG